MNKDIRQMAYELVKELRKSTDEIHDLTHRNGGDYEKVIYIKKQLCEAVAIINYNNNFLRLKDESEKLYTDGCDYEFCHYCQSYLVEDINYKEQTFDKNSDRAWCDDCAD